MTIEEFFKQYNSAAVVFDPIPSYSGDWIFTINNLQRNALKKDGKNLFEEFYRTTYQQPLTEIFKTPRILDFSVGMICKPNDNNVGRGLRYSKVDFFIRLTDYLNQYIDRYGSSFEEHTIYLKSLIAHIKGDNETLNAVYSEALKEKARKLKDVVDKEINSEYFEAAMRDYAPYKGRISFGDYIKSAYNITVLFQNGMLRLGDFFDQNLDYNALAASFEPDTFYLLFAKIIYEFNLIREKESGRLDNSYCYLYYYLMAVDEVVKTDKRYDPKIFFTLPNGKKIKYSRWQLQIQTKELLERHPEAKAISLPQLDGDSFHKYKDISLMEKITRLYSEETKVNWEFLPEGEGIKRGKNSGEHKNNVPKDKSDLVNEVNMRIDILEKSGFIGRPVKGLNTFSGYYAFIYPNGKVILEKFWENEETMNPATKAATYVMTIDNFVEMSKLSRINLIEYIRTLPEVGVKRIFHTSINNWQMNLYAEIVGSYRLEDAIEFINSLKSGAITNEQ